MEYNSEITNEEIEAFGTGSLRKAAVEGDLEQGSFMAGQIAGLVCDVRPAAEIIDTSRGSAKAVRGGSEMDKIAFVFAGQGAQAPGKGKDLYESVALVRPVFDRGEALRPGTLKQCLEGPSEELTQTLNAQPCLFLVDYACALAAREVCGQPAFAAGFSLGEMAAAAFPGSCPLRRRSAWWTCAPS
jgi:acyl transferase domain-containing protein